MLEIWSTIAILSRECCALREALFIAVLVPDPFHQVEMAEAHRESHPEEIHQAYQVAPQEEAVHRVEGILEGEIGSWAGGHPAEGKACRRAWEEADRLARQEVGRGRAYRDRRALECESGRSNFNDACGAAKVQTHVVEDRLVGPACRRVAWASH